MAFFLLLSLLFSAATGSRAQTFHSYFTNRWGPQHQSVSPDGNSVTLWLDKSSGSGFKSKTAYSSGYFGVSMKLQAGYTAGVIACYYLSNNEAHPRDHDEVDLEFLGTIPGKPYVLQTNLYMKGSGDGDHVVGREMRFNLWFDPTTSFHNYAISWNPNMIVFYVDGAAIRHYPRTSDATFPQRPMWVYGSIWDASSWATEGGLYKADYRYQPFVARYTNFRISGCTAAQPATCGAASRGLTDQQLASVKWAQSKYMVYSYCRDPSRNATLTPECSI